MGHYSRWHIVQDGTLFQVGPFSKLNIVPSEKFLQSNIVQGGTLFQVGNCLRWEIFPSGTLF